MLVRRHPALPVRAPSLFFLCALALFTVMPDSFCFLGAVNPDLDARIGVMGLKNRILSAPRHIPSLFRRSGQAFSGEPAAAAGQAPAEDKGSGETGGEKEVQRIRDRAAEIAKAKDSAESADEVVMQRLPGGVGRIAGFHLFGYSIWRYIAVAGVVFLALILWLYLRKFFADKQKDTCPILFGGWYTAMYVAKLALKNPAKFFVVGFTLKIAAWLIVTRYHPEVIWTSDMILYFAVVFYFYDLIGLVDTYYGHRIFHSPDRLLDTIRPLAFKMARALVLIIAGMHVYQSITGQTVVSILAGLGIGGLALALASQETLKNLLGFANIAFDSPFLVGDYIVVDGDEGTVEHVGMRSILIRKPDGNATILPNSNAISSSVQNKTRQPFLRRNISLRLHPNNGFEKIEKALAHVRETLEGHKGAIRNKPPIVRLEDFEPCRLVINAYFWFDPGSGDDFYAEIDRVNREIYRRLSEDGIAFSER